MPQLLENVPITMKLESYKRKSFTQSPLTLSSGSQPLHEPQYQQSYRYHRNARMPLHYAGNTAGLCEWSQSLCSQTLSADEEQHPFWSGTYQSRTHNGLEHLYLTEDKARMMEGNKSVLDDVSSTGKTFIAIHNVLKKCKRGLLFAYF